MSNYKNMLGVKTANQSVISVKPCANKYNRRKYAEEAGERFIQSASVFPDHGYLGWRIAVEKERNWSNTVYSSSNAVVTDEDYNWMFQECGVALKTDTDIDETGNEDGGKLYFLKYKISEEAKGKTSGCRELYSCDYDDENAISFERFDEFMRMMEAVGAEVMFFAFRSHEKPSVRGRIVIGVHGEISLRMRTMISFAFPYTEIYGMDDMKGDSDSYLPAEYVRRGINGFLQVLMSKNIENAEISDEALEDEDYFESSDEITGDKDQKPVELVGYTPIEELELSVRTYNCLKRAGIDSVEKLRSTPDDKLMKVRNLGLKSFREVKERLSMMSASISMVPLTSKSYRSMLDELVGLECVKEQVKKITAFARMKKEMPEDVSVPVVLNMEFVGNPGTAKTTVARILAGILNEVGLLSGNGLIEVGRADLVARYEGQTADKVKLVFNRAKGKVLFIDEAYSLLENWEGEYGDEAINTIVQEMENNRNDTVVIFAGYPDKMEDFFARNPGLRSRVPFVINFKDYTAEEMAQIANMEAEKRGFSIDQASQNRVIEICQSAIKKTNMGNGRFCRNLVEDAILSYASRVYDEENDEAICGKFTLIGKDFRIPEKHNQLKRGYPIGFCA